MMYVQSKIKIFISLCIATAFFVACNSNQSSDKTGDSVTAAARNVPADTMQTMAPDNTQTTPDNTTPDNTATANATPAATPSASSSSNATSSSASSSSNTVTKNKNVAVNKTVNKNIAVNKNIRATVEFVPVTKHPKAKMDKRGVYEYSEVNPSYPGGEPAIEAYINNHIEYPQQALDNGKEGKVGVSFIVNENGRITDVHAMGNKTNGGLDREAVRVVEAMPNWRPGMVNGRPVKTRVTLPIIFRIEG